MGLDASTSTIGLAVLKIEDGKKELLHLDHWKPPTEGLIFARLATTREWLEEELKKWKPDQVVIEDILLGHIKTNIKTLMSLAVFNRGVGMIVYDTLGQEPIYLAPITVRSRLQIGPERPKKEEMPGIVSQHLNISFPFVYNKKGKEIKENYDRADALACALAQITPPRKTNKKK